MRPQFNSWVRKFPWRRDRLPTPIFLGFPGGLDGKESACFVGDLGWKDPLEEVMATHSSILFFSTPVSLPGESPWTEEPDGLQSMGVTVD